MTSESTIENELCLCQYQLRVWCQFRKRLLLKVLPYLIILSWFSNSTFRGHYLVMTFDQLLFWRRGQVNHQRLFPSVSSLAHFSSPPSMIGELGRKQILLAFSSLEKPLGAFEILDRSKLKFKFLLNSDAWKYDEKRISNLCLKTN